MPIVRLSELLGQPEVSSYLRRIVGSGRYANAYLLHGPAGVGKGTAALAFARAALCERVPGAAPGPASAPESLFATTPAAASGDDACGACASCRKSAALAHPDLRFLFPVSGEEKDLDTTIAETVQAMRDEPTYVFRYEKAASHRLSQTRELIRQLGYRPYEASRRIVVVRDADRMREDQYSALLKSIEEPGASTVWVLTTSRLTRVPVTIRSRCQRVRFAPLPEATIEAFLAATLRDTPANARLLAALAGGSLARAIVLREGEPVQQRNEALELLGPSVRGDVRAAWRVAQGTAKFGKAGRESLRRALEFHQLWLRDLLRARYGAGEESLVNRDRAADVRENAKHIDAAEVRRRLLVIEEAMRAIDGNVSADLTLFSTLFRVAGQRLAEHAWPAHGAGRWRY